MPPKCELFVVRDDQGPILYAPLRHLSARLNESAVAAVGRRLNGSVLSEGTLTAKDLHIRVPNGGFNQQYNSQEMKLGGTTGAGAIVAAGDIDIAAKIIVIIKYLSRDDKVKKLNVCMFIMI